LTANARAANSDLPLKYRFYPGLLEIFDGRKSLAISALRSARTKKRKKYAKRACTGETIGYNLNMTTTINGVKYKVRYAYMRPDGTKWLVLNVLGGFEGEFGDEVKA
jgi:hypothetical protein